MKVEEGFSFARKDGSCVGLIIDRTLSGVSISLSLLVIYYYSRGCLLSSLIIYYLRVVINADIAAR